MRYEPATWRLLPTMTLCSSNFLVTDITEGSTLTVSVCILLRVPAPESHCHKGFKILNAFGNGSHRRIEVLSSTHRLYNATSMIHSASHDFARHAML